jgi:hypothetical protein
MEAFDLALPDHETDCDGENPGADEPYDGRGVIKVCRDVYESEQSA